MKKIKHSKYRNTGMLFELLTRQITSDIISGTDSIATGILKKFFNKNTEMIKEYRLYKTLCEEKMPTDTKSQMLIEAVLTARKKINKKKLSEEKYELIKTITENFDINSFFQTKVGNYKLLASVYKIFEYTELDSPVEITRSKMTIMENMVSESKKELIEESVSLKDEPKEIRLMSYKILVEKFNKKYGELSHDQKSLLREYISNVSNTNNLKTFVQGEASKIRLFLEQKIKKTKDKTLKIKLAEVSDLLNQYATIKNLDESHISALLRYYDLVNDLKEIK
jgi:hypothetical protein